MTVQMLQASLVNTSTPDERLMPVGTDEDEWVKFERANGRPGILSDDDSTDLGYFANTT